MIGENEERWRKLCEEAPKEQDSDRLLELVRQINQMLADKERRLQDKIKRQDGSS
jgi:hypothetical protein